MNLVWVLLLSLLTTSCATQQSSPGSLPFDQQRVCSAESLNYLKTAPQFVPSDATYERVLTLAPEIKKCYDNEIVLRNSYPPFNLCLVVGYDRAGAIEYFQFSTSDTELSPDMNRCLANLITQKSIRGPREIAVVQPFRIEPAE